MDINKSDRKFVSVPTSDEEKFYYEYLPFSRLHFDRRTIQSNLSPAADTGGAGDNEENPVGEAEYHHLLINIVSELLFFVYW